MQMPPNLGGERVVFVNRNALLNIRHNVNYVSTFLLLLIGSKLYPSYYVHIFAYIVRTRPLLVYLGK